MTTATRTYSPVILQPRMRRPQPGITVYQIQSEKDLNAFYFVWIQPSGHIRCECKAAKYHHGQCKHIDALKDHLAVESHKQPGGSPRLSNVIAQAESVAAKAERAVLASHVPETFSIYR